jgi:hypothetical protein
MPPKLIAFIVAFGIGLYFLSTGSLILGLIFVCLAILIPAA